VAGDGRPQLRVDVNLLQQSGHVAPPPGSGLPRA
jgi:hypothetical protein